MFFCESCGCEKKMALLDGYIFGDREMEGVMFEVDSYGNCLGVHDKDMEASIKKQYNWEYWKKRCEETAKTYDVFECPDCKDDIYVD